MKSIKRKFWAIMVLVGLMAAVTYSAPPSYGPSDRQLVKKIRKELVTLPYYGVFDNLAFEVNGGTVTLYGQVVRPTTKSDAEHRVARLSGVTRVINRINVLPLSSFDDSIRLRTYREL